MTLSRSSQFNTSLFLLFVINVCYFFWSFALTDPNLVYSQAPIFWSFQQFVWQIPKTNIALMYGLMVLGMLACSWRISSLAESLKLSLKKWLLIFLFVTSPLILSNNALSHDVFNYIFNAKMVVKYQMNPHVEVAQHFTYDPWIRFMHNVHTSAPYFYGWTALSLPPYVLGFEKFVLTWILFRLWSVFSVLICFVAVWLLMKKKGVIDIKSFVFLLFNPLIMIELISNSHNDGWMMAPALLSLVLVYQGKNNQKLNWLKIVFSLILLLVSISTKYVTILLLPVWMWIVLSNLINLNTVFNSPFNNLKLKIKNLNEFDISAILLFIPLLTDRSQQFHPWYLVWCLPFLPLMSNKVLKLSLILLSVSSLLRYIPWLWNGAFGYTDQILLQEKMITWIFLGVGLIMYCLFNFLKRSSNKTS